MTLCINEQTCTVYVATSYHVHAGTCIHNTMTLWNAHKCGTISQHVTVLETVTVGFISTYTKQQASCLCVVHVGFISMLETGCYVATTTIFPQTTHLYDMPNSTSQSVLLFADIILFYLS